MQSAEKNAEPPQSPAPEQNEAPPEQRAPEQPAYNPMADIIARHESIVNRVKRK